MLDIYNWIRGIPVDAPPNPNMNHPILNSRTCSLFFAEGLFLPLFHGLVLLVHPLSLLLALGRALQIHPMLVQQVEHEGLPPPFRLGFSYPLLHHSLFVVLHHSLLLALQLSQLHNTEGLFLPPLLLVVRLYLPNFPHS